MGEGVRGMGEGRRQQGRCLCVCVCVCVCVCEMEDREGGERGGGEILLWLIHAAFDYILFTFSLMTPMQQYHPSFLKQNQLYVTVNKTCTT